MSDAHEYPPCTGQCCQGLAVATERLDAAQAQLYALRDEIQAINVRHGEALSLLRRWHGWSGSLVIRRRPDNLRDATCQLLAAHPEVKP